jgi:PPK2 family polyphosphate:nucleotide phosphotransferase
MPARSKKREEFARKFMVKPGGDFRMKQLDPSSTPGIKSKKEGRAELEWMTQRLSELQRVFYAECKHSILVVLQAMDTGGKDGTIRHVFGPLNPQGVRVSSFKAPSAEELAHDFLWRIHVKTPKKGMIRIFNRSHYEDVLVVRVHNLVPKREVDRRYGQINAFEKHLTENGTTVLKFCLHISKKEQKERLQARLARPDKHWKFNSADLAERKLWNQYERAYERAISECSMPWAPWYVIPSDRKWYRNYAVARIVIETLESMKLRYPKSEQGLDKIVVED